MKYGITIEDKDGGMQTNFFGDSIQAIIELEKITELCNRTGTHKCYMEIWKYDEETNTVSK